MIPNTTSMTESPRRMVLETLVVFALMEATLLAYFFTGML